MKYNFSFDPKLKQYYYSTNYFVKSIEILKNKKNTTAMQFVHFCEEPIVVCGIQESIELLKFVLGNDFDKIEILSQKDGNIISNQEPILVIKGEYKYFGYLENIIDGILSCRSSVATNVSRILNILKPSQELIYMADRTTSYFNQPYDAYPAHMCGVNLFVTEAQIKFFKNDKNVKVVGTMPHALIQQFAGNLANVIDEYNNTHNLKPYALIDYHNDVISELDSIRDKLNNIVGVRIDTSRLNVDQSLINKNIHIPGINYELVKNVREWLDINGGKHLKIIVSSGLDYHDIQKLNIQNAPIDYFGVGSSLLTNSVHVSADLVLLNDKLESKFGRTKKDWANLEVIK